MQSCRVLIVEDENIVALDLCRRLNNLGYEIVGTAASADKAFRLIEKKQPDVIPTDIRIKGNVRGIEVADKVHRGVNIPVIFLTTYSEEATLARTWYRAKFNQTFPSLPAINRIIPRAGYAGTNLLKPLPGKEKSGTMTSTTMPRMPG
ncbi:response regulator [Porticoccus sp.]